jgi:predicted peptidase
MSPERKALIGAFQEKAAGLEKAFEAREYQKDWVMPYRLFRPAATGSVPLVLYLHGSGGLGRDNNKQLGLGNVFGTRVWALPENQKRFPCFIVVPQTDRGWARYQATQTGEAEVIAGLGEGSEMALAIVEQLCREFPIDHRCIYVTGQSMGGAGVWNMITHRDRYFAAAVPCCGSPTHDDPAQAIRTPLWNFHGAADDSVPVKVSRERIAALRKAGGHPISTEYAGVGHEVWEWAFTEPALVDWVFAQRQPA